jgi:ABC-type phosphate transport system substrate-binding protein
MNRNITTFFFTVSLLTACSTPTPQATPQLINVNVSSAAYPWLGEFYNCTAASTFINLSDPQSADITLRLGEPDKLTSPAFQISTEDILVIAHGKTGVSTLNLDQVKSLFLGQTMNWKEVGGNDIPVQVWAYAPDEDIQLIFSKAVLNGQPVSSLARLAGSALYMLNSVGTSPGSIGLLPRHLLSAEAEDLYKVATVPVLAITKTAPQGALKELIGCLQANH